MEIIGLDILLIFFTVVYFLYGKFCFWFTLKADGYKYKYRLGTLKKFVFRLTRREYRINLKQARYERKKETREKNRTEEK